MHSAVVWGAVHFDTATNPGVNAKELSSSCTFYREDRISENRAFSLPAGLRDRLGSFVNTAWQIGVFETI